MSNHDIIAIGGSTGSQRVLQQVFSGFTAALNAALFVVVHTPSNGRNLLADILGAAV